MDERKKVPSSFFPELASSVLHHLQQIPYILWYPIAALIHLLYSVSAYIYHWLDDRVNRHAARQKRLTRLTRRAVQSVLNTRSNKLHTSFPSRVCQLFTLLLQFISLLTTYAGFTFFLKHINPFAPILLAVVVQGTFYFLINARALRKREGAWKRRLLLLVALLISTTTSFVGISNTVRSPVEDMKASYNAYRTAHNDYLRGQVVKADIFTEAEIREALDACAKIRTSAEISLTAINEAMPADDSITNTTASSFVSGYTDDGSPLYGYSTGKSTNTELEERRGRLRGLYAQIEAALQNLRSDPYDLDAAAIYSACSAPERSEAENQIYLDFLACLNEYAALEKLIAPVNGVIQGTETNAAPETTIDPKYFSEAKLDAYHGASALQDDAELDEYEAVMKADSGAVEASSPMISTATRALSDLEALLVSPELSQAEIIRNTLNQAMIEKYALLSFDGQNALKAAFQSAQIPSSQLYPFRYLAQTSNQDWGSSLQALLLASLIDLLSLLLALTLINRRDSVLYAKNRRENARNREELLEDCYTCLCLRKLTSDQPQKPVRTAADIRALVAHTVEDTVLQLVRRIRVCYLPDALDSFGYLTDGDLRSCTWEAADLFQTLRLLQLIRPITKSELAALLYAAFPDVQDPGNPEISALPRQYIDGFPDELLYLMDNRLLMWHNEYFSQLLQANILSDDVQLFTKTPGSQPAIKGGVAS